MDTFKCSVDKNIGEIQCSSSVIDNLNNLDAIAERAAKIKNGLNEMEKKYNDKLFGNKNYKYLGCYEDKRARALPHGFSSHSIDECYNKLKEYNRQNNTSYNYFALQYGSQCFIGDNYAKYGKADNSRCNMKCKSGELCGGGYANSVYLPRDIR